MQARVIDQKDEMYDFVGDVMYVHDDGMVEIYFDDGMGMLKYTKEQVELLGKVFE
jgi:hypothetical protein